MITGVLGLVATLVALSSRCYHQLSRPFEDEAAAPAPGSRPVRV